MKSEAFICNSQSIPTRPFQLCESICSFFIFRKPLMSSSSSVSSFDSPDHGSSRFPLEMVTLSNPDPLAPRAHDFEPVVEVKSRKRRRTSSDSGSHGDEKTPRSRPSFLSGDLGVDEGLRKRYINMDFTSCEDTSNISIHFPPSA